ncbi:MAG: hypothetical protein L0Y48_01420, partial [Fusobacteria bacterium]|nr:hypothetical protein [Fusobacteriota bacterium]
IKPQGYYGKFKNKEYLIEFNSKIIVKLYHEGKKSKFKKNDKKLYSYLEVPITEVNDLHYKYYEGSHKGFRGRLSVISKESNLIKIEISTSNRFDEEYKSKLLKNNFKIFKDKTAIKEINIKELKDLWEIRQDVALKKPKLSNIDNYVFLEIIDPDKAIEINRFRGNKAKVIVFNKKDHLQNKEIIDKNKEFAASRPIISLSIDSSLIYNNAKNFLTTTKMNKGETEVVIEGNYGIYKGLECYFLEVGSNKAKLITADPVAENLGFEKKADIDVYTRTVFLKEIKEIEHVYNEGEYSGQRGKVVRAYVDADYLKLIINKDEMKIKATDLDKIWEIREKLILLERGYDEAGNIIYDIRKKSWAGIQEILIKERTKIDGEDAVH